MTGGRESGGATPVVGNILLVAVALVIAVVPVTLSFSFLDATGTPTAEAEFEYEQTGGGLEMRPVALGTDVHVELNGQRVATFESGSAGQRKLIPTAPGVGSGSTARGTTSTANPWGPASTTRRSEWGRSGSARTSNRISSISTARKSSG